MNALVGRGGLLDDFFKDINPGFYVRPLHSDLVPSQGQIKVDVTETDTGYIISAEVPGVPKDDIHVSLDGNMVSMRAEIRPPAHRSQEQKSLRSERYFGVVARSFQLPSDIDAAQAKAKYEHGVLTLTLPKKIGGSAQRLAIE